MRVAFPRPRLNPDQEIFGLLVIRSKFQNSSKGRLSIRLFSQAALDNRQIQPRPQLSRIVLENPLPQLHCFAVSVFPGIEQRQVPGR